MHVNCILMVRISQDMIDMKQERKIIEYRKLLDPDGLYDGDVLHVEKLLDEIENLQNKCLALCDRWEGMLGSVGDTSIGFEQSARELHEVIKDETNSNF